MFRNENKETKKSYGDVNIDYMVAQGIIKNVKTCCDNSVCTDHDLSIELNDGRTIESYNTLASNQILIKDQNIQYSMKDHGEKMASFLSLFVPIKTPASEPYEFTKIMTVANEKKVLTISKEEFNVILKSIPQALINLLMQRFHGFGNAEALSFKKPNMNK